MTDETRDAENEEQAQGASMQKVIREGKATARIIAGFGGLIFVFSTAAALGGSSDATVIACTRSAPDAAVDCVVVNSFLGVERARLEIPRVLRASHRYHQPTRGNIVYVETPERDDIYLGTTEGEVFRQLNAFIEDTSRKRFEWREEPPALFNVVAIGFGALVGLFGLFKWLSWRRKRSSSAMAQG